MRNSSISVIIPVYNCEKYLPEAVRSILSQSCRPEEIIIVDDGSTDRTAEIVMSFGKPVKYIWQRNAGASAARNRAIQAARGDFFAFLDSDDTWTAEKVEKQLAAFEQNPDADIISGHIKQFFSPDLPAEFREKIKCTEDLIPGYAVGAMMIKREAFFSVGLFSTEWEIGEVIDWYARAFEKKLKIVMLPDCVYLRRLHQSNKGITHRDFAIQRARILKASLDRRRKSGLLK